MNQREIASAFLNRLVLRLQEQSIPAVDIYQNYLTNELVELEYLIHSMQAIQDLIEDDFNIEEKFDELLDEIYDSGNNVLTKKLLD